MFTQPLRAAMVLAALNAAVLACGDDAADDGAAIDAGRVSDAADEGPALAEVGPLLAESLCPSVFTCCSEADLREVFDEIEPTPTDETSCVAALTGPLSQLMADREASVDAGRSRYSASAMASCLVRIQGASCGEFAAWFGDLEEWSTCDAPPFIPLVEDGGACTRNDECTGGLCRRSEDDVGTCAALPGEGADCPDSICAADLFCDEVGRTCVPRRSDGDTCSQDDQCLSGACLGDTCGPSGLCDGEG